MRGRWQQCYLEKTNNDSIVKIITKLRVLGIYQVLGGAFGAVFLLWGFWHNRQLMPPLALVLFWVMLSFFIFSIYCGIACLVQTNNALKVSLGNQILQVIGFAMFGFAFQYAAGIYLIAILDLTESFNLRFGAGLFNFDFKVHLDSERLKVTFNFMALAVVVFIEKLKKQIGEDQNKKQISSIGTV
jgi:hypothetical protein